MQAHYWDPFQTLSGPSCRPETGFTNVAGKEHENCSKFVNFVSWNHWKSVYKQYKTIIQLHLGYTSIQASKTARRNARSDWIFRFLWGNSCVENCHCYWDYNMQRALMGAENVCFGWNYSLFFDCFSMHIMLISYRILVRKTRPKKNGEGSRGLGQSCDFPEAPNPGGSSRRLLLEVVWCALRTSQQLWPGEF